MPCPLCHDDPVDTMEKPTVLDRHQLRNITMDDEELMHEIVAALVDDTAKQIERLAEAVGSGAVQDSMRLAHSAKGACGNVGAVSLASLFGAIEHDARRGSLVGAIDRVISLRLELEKLRSEAGNI